MYELRNKMDSMYKQFGFNPAKFREMLTLTGSFVAGGAAAHMLRGGNPADFDGDLDIWYTYAPTREQEEGDKYYIVKVNAYHDASKLIDDYIVEHGYKRTPNDQTFTLEYTNKENPLSKEILVVHSYTFMKRNVQVIYALKGPDEILDSFDYSFCAVGCDHTGGFFGKDLDLTRQGKGYPLMPSRNEERDTMRREKYAKRGFTIVEKV